MTESDILNLTDSIENGDVQGMQAALESATPEAGAAKVGKATVKSHYESQTGVLRSAYSIDVKEAGFSLAFVGIVVTAAPSVPIKLPLASDTGKFKEHLTAYSGNEALTNLATHKGQTLKVRVFGVAIDSKSKKRAFILADTTVKIP